MLTTQITIKDDLPSSPALKAHIEERVHKLERFYNRITSCRVVVAMTQKHKHRGKLFSVKVDLTVPRREIVVTHKHNEDAYVAVRDAFNAVESQLEDHADKRKGRVKTHDAMSRGFVKRVLADEGYGFIEGMDGNEYYFSDLNVGHPSFRQLAIGDAVEFTPHIMSNGRHAHHINKVS